MGLYSWQFLCRIIWRELFRNLILPSLSIYQLFRNEHNTIANWTELRNCFKKMTVQFSSLKRWAFILPTITVASWLGKYPSNYYGSITLNADAINLSNAGNTCRLLVCIRPATIRI